MRETCEHTDDLDPAALYLVDGVYLCGRCVADAAARLENEAKRLDESLREANDKRNEIDRIVGYTPSGSPKITPGDMSNARVRVRQEAGALALRKEREKKQTELAVIPAAIESRSPDGAKNFSLRLLQGTTLGDLRREDKSAFGHVLLVKKEEK